MLRYAEFEPLLQALKLLKRWVYPLLETISEQVLSLASFGVITMDVTPVFLKFNLSHSNAFHNFSAR